MIAITLKLVILQLLGLAQGIHNALASLSDGAPPERNETEILLRQDRLSGRTYAAYGITAPTPPRGDSGKGSIVIAITS